MKPHLTCLMISSLDGSLAPSPWTTGPRQSRTAWSQAHAALHKQLGGEAWLVGRITMVEMLQDAPPSIETGTPERPHHFADRTATSFAIDLPGRLRPAGPSVDGDQVVLLLGAEVSESHFNALAGVGASYIVSDTAEVEFPKALSVLSAGLGDEVSAIVAPALDGRAGKRTIVEAGPEGLAGRFSLELMAFEKLEGGMVHLRYTVAPTGAVQHQVAGAAP